VRVPSDPPHPLMFTARLAIVLAIVVAVVRFLVVSSVLRPRSAVDRRRTDVARRKGAVLVQASAATDTAGRSGAAPNGDGRRDGLRVGVGENERCREPLQVDCVVGSEAYEQLIARRYHLLRNLHRLCK